MIQFQPSLFTFFSTHTRKFFVSIQPPVGELMTPAFLTENDFKKEQGKRTSAHPRFSTPSCSIDCSFSSKRLSFYSSCAAVSLWNSFSTVDMRERERSYVSLSLFMKYEFHVSWLFLIWILLLCTKTSYFHYQNFGSWYHRPLSRVL